MQGISMTWWLWILLGLVLLAGEILTPGGFFILFFGLGAILVGLLKLTGMNSLVAEGLIFVTVSVALLLLFRQRLMHRFKAGTRELPLDNLAQETGVALEAIPAGGRGKVELRGTQWTAQNVGESAIAERQRCQVEKAEGLTLFVRGI